jgi:hypothetical protein
VESHERVLLEPAADLWRAVCRRVVEDHVKLSLGAVLAAALVPSHDR